MSTIVRSTRDLRVDIYDYSGNKVCPIFDSTTDIVGQATNVVIITERNGWKELSFTLPGNDYREKYLVADYKIKTVENNTYEDWYLITKPSVRHQGHAKNITVNAGHVSQLLKTKNLGLEFSDEEGNNVGTASDLLSTILDGTGWSVGNVETFYEDRLDADSEPVVKYRSLKAGAKTGAFKLIQQMCELFEAKPIYHGATKTVDIVAINPFAKLTDEQIVTTVDPTNVIELHYGTNVKTMTRNYNTENMVSKLYAYGAYGNAKDEGGYCGLDECTHWVHSFVLQDTLDDNTTYWFQITDSTGQVIKRNFTTTREVEAGHILCYSELDAASMMYIYDANAADDVDCAWLLRQGQDGTLLAADYEAHKDEQNWFSFLMDFNYYSDCGLFTHEMLQKLARYQYEGSWYLKTINDAAAIYAADYTKLTSNIGVVDYCKLNVTAITDSGDGHILLTLNDPDKVIYRTDYTAKPDKYFKWRKANYLKDNGDPINEEASVIYCIQYNADGQPTGIYYKFYIKAFDNDDDPYALTLFGQYTANKFDNCDFYLFSSNSVNGLLGAYEAFNEAATLELDAATTSVTVKHPVIFSETEPPIQIYEPEIDFPVPTWVTSYKAQYAWWCKIYPPVAGVYDDAELYFCYKTAGDDGWKRAWIGDLEPYSGADINNGDYCFVVRQSKLYRRVSGEWVWLDEDDDRTVTTLFGTVFMYCCRKEMYRIGLAQKYEVETEGVFTLLTSDTAPSDFSTKYKLYYKLEGGLYTPCTYVDAENYTANTYYSFSGYAPGNWYIKDGYGNYWIFTSDSNATKFSYDTTDGFVTESVANSKQVDASVAAKTVNFSACKYHPENVFAGTSYEDGYLDNNGGEAPQDDDHNGYRRTHYCNVYSNLPYIFTGNTGHYHVCWYTQRHTFISDNNIDITNAVTSVTINSPNNARFVRVCFNSDEADADVSMHTVDYDTAIIVGEYNETYYPADGTITTIAPYKGLEPLIKEFYIDTDKVYLEDLPAVIEAQVAYNAYENEFKESVGDLYREGYWQKEDYVDGDENKLYADALDNLKQISKPEATYQIEYLDLFGAHMDAFNGGLVQWPDFDTSVAVHVVDPEISVNCWAYVEKLSKCYDQPEKTAITINTNLNTCTQHSFTDVMTNIADVASQVKSKVGMYDRASAISSDGTIPATSIEGSINTEATALTGCGSTWYTDSDGNIMLVAVDGQSAMKLFGGGYSIANSKDKYGDWIWTSFGNGNGFNASVITAGFMSAERIQAHSITSDQIAADTITSRELKANSITAEELAANSVTAKAIAAEAVNAEKIEAGSITTDRVDSGFGSSLDLKKNMAIIEANEKIDFVVTESGSPDTRFEIAEAGMKFIGSNIYNHLEEGGVMKTVIDGSNAWLTFSDSGLVQGREDSRFVSRMADDGFYIHHKDIDSSIPVEDTEVVGKFVASGLETTGVKIGNIISKETSAGGWVWQWKET